MKTTTLLLSLLFLAACQGGNDNSSVSDKSQTDTTTQGASMTKPKRVTGVGGVFFKAEDPEKLRDWYRDHLGLVTNEYGSLFEFRSTDKPEEKGYLQWSPFSAETKYFEPSKKDFMINYRVENLERLIEQLRAEDVTILDTIESYDYGKFAHVIDPEGNKIELWEPVDSDFTRLYEGKTTH